MAQGELSNATVTLTRALGGDAEAEARLVSLTYKRLRELARKYMQNERRDHTLQATALVHEAYIRLIDNKHVDWQGKTHFLAVAARQMRHVLVDHARGRNREKRGGDRVRIQFEDVERLTGTRDADVLDLAQALEELAAVEERPGRVVELRFFAGLTVDEVAAALGISPETVKKDWSLARAWLHRRLTG